MSRPTILEFGVYRVVDFGEDVYFEQRAADALGNEKWDNVMELRGARMTLPAGLIFGLLSLAEREPETKPAEDETIDSCAGTEPESGGTIDQQLYALQQRRREKHRREVA